MKEGKGLGGGEGAGGEAARRWNLGVGLFSGLIACLDCSAQGS